MTVVLGLTGSIGMGKSTTAEMFRALGVPVWDADATVHKLYNVGGAAVPEVARLAPDAVVDEQVDRAALKAAISSDPSLLKELEAVVHPLVAEDRQKFRDEHVSAPLIVLDIPLLFETGGDKVVDAVLVVSVDAVTQRKRVLERGTMNEAQFQTILERQIPDPEKRERADYVIETRSLDGTRKAVQTLVNALTKTDTTHA